MHGTTLAAQPPFTYWSPDSLKAMDAVRQLRKKAFHATLRWMLALMSKF